MDELGVIRQKNYTKNQQTRDVVLKTLIIGTGNITKVYAKGKRADVSLTYMDASSKPVIVRGVELLRMGTPIARRDTKKLLRKPAPTLRKLATTPTR